jgi:hypothetical protein
VSQYLGPKFNANNKSEVKIVNLLTHDAGFPPDPVPGYWEIAFACPETVAHPGEQASSISSLFFFFFEKMIVSSSSANGLVVWKPDLSVAFESNLGDPAWSSVRLFGFVVHHHALRVG